MWTYLHSWSNGNWHLLQTIYFFVNQETEERDIHRHSVRKMSNTMKRAALSGGFLWLINNTQLDKTLKDHKISLPFLPRIQASANNLPLLNGTAEKQ